MKKLFGLCRYYIKETASFIAFWVLVFSPFLAYLVVRWFFSPEGFWQEIFLFGGWAIVLGWLQAIFLYLGIKTAIEEFGEKAKKKSVQKAS